MRSEEHTSELQSHSDLVCRLLLDPAHTEISTLSLHDALPISAAGGDDLVAVPVALSDKLLAPLRLQQPAAVLFIELAPPAGADIALISSHQAILDRLAANLDEIGRAHV